MTRTILAVVATAAISVVLTLLVTNQNETDRDWWNIDEELANAAQPPCLDRDIDVQPSPPESPIQDLSEGEPYYYDEAGRIDYVNPCLVTSGWTPQPIEWLSPGGEVLCFYAPDGDWLCSTNEIAN